jgi:two-component system alkaline phosphatase synthesis response regulator PhoP
LSLASGANPILMKLSKNGVFGNLHEKDMSKYTILAVEDEEDILELIRYNLEKEGYQVIGALSGEAARPLVAQKSPDLILLDLMLPGIGGLDLCRALKQSERTRHIPVVMLTAKSEDADVVAGLEIGADDYITKPFSPRVLLARVRAVLRRSGSGPVAEDAVLVVETLRIHPGRHEVTLAGETIHLTLTEFKILHFLARHPGWVYTRDQIIDAVRGEDYAVTDRAIDVQIVGLRKKLGEQGNVIETVRGIGYRFKDRD